MVVLTVAIVDVLVRNAVVVVRTMVEKIEVDVTIGRVVDVVLVVVHNVLTVAGCVITLVTAAVVESVRVDDVLRISVGRVVKVVTLMVDVTYTS
jgi:hypothetical protein